MVFVTYCRQPPHPMYISSLSSSVYNQSINQLFSCTSMINWIIQQATLNSLLTCAELWVTIINIVHKYVCDQQFFPPFSHFSIWRQLLCIQSLYYVCTKLNFIRSKLLEILLLWYILQFKCMLRHVGVQECYSIPHTLRSQIIIYVQCIGFSYLIITLRLPTHFYLIYSARNL